MEADHLRPQIDHNLAHRLVEWQPVRKICGGRSIKSKFRIVSGETFPPPALAICIRRWGEMAKEIEIHGPGRTLSDEPKRGRHLIRGQHGARKRAESASLRDGDR